MNQNINAVLTVEIVDFRRSREVLDSFRFAFVPFAGLKHGAKFQIHKDGRTRTTKELAKLLATETANTIGLRPSGTLPFATASCVVVHEADCELKISPDNELWAQLPRTETPRTYKAVSSLRSFETFVRMRNVSMFPTFFESVAFLEMKEHQVAEVLEDATNMLRAVDWPDEVVAFGDCALIKHRVPCLSARDRVSSDISLLERIKVKDDVLHDFTISTSST